MFRIVRQTPTRRLEIACGDCGHLMWPLPGELVNWEACPLCLMFPGKRDETFGATVHAANP